MSVEVKTKQKSDRAVAEELLADYAEWTKQNKALGKELKEMEAELLELAEKHPDWFDGKTANFENGQLKWVAASTVKVPEDFDLKGLQKIYPALVDVKVTESIPVSKLRAYMDDPKMSVKITEMGISIETVDKFKVVA